MSPLIAMPVAIPQEKEHELEQEFELDIRIFAGPERAIPSIPAPTQSPSCATCKTECGSCYCTRTCTCFTCGRTCSCPTCYCCP